LEAKFGSSVVVAGAPGRKSSFEITVGNDEASRKVIYSKLASGSFPDPDGVIAAVAKYIEDGSVQPIGEAKGGCTVQ
jgi:hypothetical protein